MPIFFPILFFFSLILSLVSLLTGHYCEELTADPPDPSSCPMVGVQLPHHHLFLAEKKKKKTAAWMRVKAVTRERKEKV